jgi:hypothetical protein
MIFSENRDPLFGIMLTAATGTSASASASAMSEPFWDHDGGRNGLAADHRGACQVRFEPGAETPRHQKLM